MYWYQYHFKRPANTTSIASNYMKWKIPIPIFRKVALTLDNFCEYKNHNDILPTTKQIPYVYRVFKVFKQLEWIKLIFEKLIQMRQMKLKTGVYDFVI